MYPRHRDDQHEHERQLPANEAGRSEAGDAFERFADHLAEEDLEPDADLLGVIGEAGHQVRCSGPRDLAHILMEGPAKEGISQVEEHTEGDVANKRFVDEFERAANEDADHDRSHDPEDRLEAIFGHVADDAGLERVDTDRPT